MDEDAASVLSGLGHVHGATPDKSPTEKVASSYVRHLQGGTTWVLCLSFEPLQGEILGRPSGCTLIAKKTRLRATDIGHVLAGCGRCLKAPGPEPKSARQLYTLLYMLCPKTGLQLGPLKSVNLEWRGLGCPVIRVCPCAFGGVRYLNNSKEENREPAREFALGNDCKLSHT